ncbi:hypothetical protein KFL_000360305 [Klebsormidium nitens]|uniref:Trichohyalin-plectin-homology domain-containing protein n=1 Tax=Klebsormidium nitens TaxID=105231 RepID=A0A1Y1HM76_KLENI|nr:hypothetical protein KFL_000360305 [Klebsormidium nitens]|eukprot:GAQ79715.1 hypothetical protein KFL_000360305 [Klebsormidium nitens]
MGPTERHTESALTSQAFANQSSSKWGQESRKIGNTAKMPSKATLALDLSTLHKLENEHVLDILEPSGLPSRRTVQVINRTSKALSEWAALSAYDQEVFAQHKKALAEKHKTATDKQRAILDEQRRELEEKRQEIIRERGREAQRIAQELQQHKEVEKQKEEERLRDSTRKEAQRHQLQQTQLENEAQRAEARRQKLIEGEKDKKLMEDYNALLEAQDRARQQRLKEQQNMIMKRMRIGELTQKQNDEKMKQLDDQIAEHERRREQMEREKEAANRRRRQNDNTRILATLQQQKEELRDRIDREANENRRFQEQATAEAAQVLAEQALNRIKKREKSLQYRLELERQIRDTAEQHAKDGIFMSPTERTLNSRLLHDALPIYETKLHSP